MPTASDTLPFKSDYGRYQRTWWLAQADDGGDDAPQLVGDSDAEICIVGGGFTGLWTALRIKEHDPNIDVAVLEAETCGSGASGANGGFALTYWHHFTTLAEICGTTEALRMCHASADAVAEIGQFCEQHGIDAGYRHDGWFWTASNEAQLGRWQRTVDAIERAGAEPFRPVGRDELHDRTGSPRQIGGVYERSAATLQPAALVRGLRRVALAAGVRIYERSPMTTLERGAPLVVRTDRGSIRAGRVVLAMNAWSLRIRELARAFAIVSSDLSVTPAIPDRLAALGWTDGASVSDSRLLVHYWRTTPDGRIAFGRGGNRITYGTRITAALRGNSPAASWLTDSFHAFYPELEDIPTEAAWCGPIDRPVDGMPFFTTLGRDDLIVGAGFAGNGVGPCVLAGRTLAAMALGLSDEWACCGLVRRPPGGMPPEPLRNIGGRIVRNAVARHEAAEDSGRRPTVIDRRLTALAPAGLVPVD